MLRGFVLCRLVRFDGVVIESSRDAFHCSVGFYLCVLFVVLVSLAEMKRFIRIDMVSIH